MERLRHAHIMNRLCNRPLLVRPETAAMIYNVVAERSGLQPVHVSFPGAEQRMRPRASRFEGEFVPGAEGRGIEPYKISNGVAILSIIGELVNRGAWIGSASGLVSYEGLKYQLKRISRDSRVGSVLLDIDSPGGEAAGISGAADAIRKLNEQKPVHAMVNDMAASAAYWLASGAKRIVATQTGLAGSIGVVMLHLDFSKQAEMVGVTPTFVFAGAHKVDANPLEPLAEGVKEELQAEVDHLYGMFIKAVGRNRQDRGFDSKAAKDTEARVFIGAEAVKAKLADETGTFENLLADMEQRRSARKAARGKAMTRRAANLDDDDDPREPEAPEFSVTFEGTTYTRIEDYRYAVAGKSAADAVARFAAILADERSKGRERYALDLACKSPDMTADAVLDFVAQLPVKSEEKGTRSMADRNASTGADKVDPAQEPKPDATKGLMTAGQKQNDELRRSAPKGVRTALG